jgi:hypothetical protein
MAAVDGSRVTEKKGPAACDNRPLSDNTPPGDDPHLTKSQHDLQTVVYGTAIGGGA